jgi:hypothetical protein
MTAGTWIGPAILAAFISGLVSLLVVQLDFRQSRKSEHLRRAEKIRDFQIALRAEIRGELSNLSSYDFPSLLKDVRSRYKSEPGYSVSVPRLARHLIFEAIVGEIHILPEAVIDPVVLYARQRQAVESLVDDMRDRSFRELSTDRQLAIYEDYIRMWETWRDLAAQAEAALNEQLGSIAGSRSSLTGDGLGRG